MSEENNQEQAPDGGSGGAGEANGSAPSLNILAQYVKDLSFENPLAPAAAKAQDGGPDVDIRINVNGRHLQDNDYEVVLHFKGKQNLAMKPRSLLSCFMARFSVSRMCQSKTSSQFY